MRLNAITENQISEIIKMENNSETSEFIITYSEEKHRTEIVNRNNHYTGIYENGKLLGFFILGIEQEGKRIEFRRIVIEQKGYGYGQKAITELEEYCKAMWNTESIWLDVFAYNHRGIHIYEKLGYIKTGESSFIGKQLIIMEKNLLPK
ncbi:MAG: N-acetyltransferase [Flavobacterium sp.]|nr:N-acetyltransferase [Flavobacterium sp.]